MKKLIIGILLFSVISSQVSALGFPFFTKSKLKSLGIQRNIKRFGIAAAGCMGALGIYKGITTHSKLKEIEKFMKDFNSCSLNKDDFERWHINNNGSTFYYIPQYIVEHKNDMKNILSKDIKKSCIDIACLSDKIETQKKELENALLYLYDRSETPQKFFDYCVEEKFKNITESSEKNKFNNLETLCTDPRFLQQWYKWDEHIKDFQKKCVINNSFFTFFNRTILYMPSASLWRWKLIPCATKADQLFFALLKKYTRLCALYNLFKEVIEEIIPQVREENSNPAVTNEQ